MAEHRFSKVFAMIALFVAVAGVSIAPASESSRAGAFGTPEWRDPALTVLPDLDVFVSGVRHAFGARFAGVWLDRPDDAAQRNRTAWLRVSIVGATETDRGSISRMAGRNPLVQVVSAKYSLASLESWKEVLSDYLHAARVSRVIVDADESANVVTVTTATPPSGLAAHAAARGIPDDAWRLVSAGAPLVMPTHSSRAGALPYEAGLEGTVTTAGGAIRGYCTTWFTTKTSVGNYKGATAGHCESAATDHMKLGSTDLGDGALNSYLNQTRTNSDAVRYSLTVTQATNRVLYTTPNNHYPVRSRFYVSTNGGLPMNTYLCFAGRTSGAVCGFVNRVNFSAQDSDGVWHDNWWRLDRPSQGGDSGAPVFQIVSGTVKAAGLQDATDGSNAYFHHVSYVMEDLQTTLHTG